MSLQHPQIVPPEVKWKNMMKSSIGMTRVGGVKQDNNNMVCSRTLLVNMIVLLFFCTPTLLSLYLHLIFLIVGPPCPHCYLNLFLLLDTFFSFSIVYISLYIYILVYLPSSHNYPMCAPPSFLYFLSFCFLYFLYSILYLSLWFQESLSLCFNLFLIMGCSPIPTPTLKRGRERYRSG